MTSSSRSPDDISNDISKVEEKLQYLYREKTKLDLQSYSQSDPGAVMDRRWIRRDIESNERKLVTLRQELKQKSHAS